MFFENERSIQKDSNNKLNFVCEFKSKNSPTHKKCSNKTKRENLGEPLVTEQRKGILWKQKINYLVFLFLFCIF